MLLPGPNFAAVAAPSAACTLLALLAGPRVTAGREATVALPNAAVAFVLLLLGTSFTAGRETTVASENAARALVAGLLLTELLGVTMSVMHCRYSSL